jgi:hypothetical protein
MVNMNEYEAKMERLIADDIATIRSAMDANDVEYLYWVLKYGTGYANAGFEAITAEYNDRTWENE